VVKIERFFEYHKLDTPPLVTNIYTGSAVRSGVASVSEPDAAGRPSVWRAEKQPKYKAGTIG
jgi:hypothetical protein